MNHDQFLFTKNDLNSVMLPSMLVFHRLQAHGVPVKSAVVTLEPLGVVIEVTSGQIKTEVLDACIYVRYIP